MTPIYLRAKQDDKLNEAITKFTDDQKKQIADTEHTALLQRQELLRERKSVNIVVAYKNLHEIIRWGVFYMIS